MVEHTHSIRTLIRRLIWRERALICLDVAARGLVVLGVAGGLAVVTAALDVDRGLAAAFLTVWLGVGAWAAFVLPLLTRWRTAGDPLRQARLVEGLQPELRGRLITSVERLDGPRPGESAFMAERIAKKAVAVASLVPESAVHQMIRPVLVLTAAAALVLLPLPASFIAGGPLAVVGWWTTGLDDVQSLVDLQLASDSQKAKVGDLVLRYTYPPYTGLEPRLVENSTGDASGPPGTVVTVRARSANPLEAAGLVAYEQRFEAHMLDDRTMEASLTLQAGEGAYHLVTYRSGEPLDSRDFKLVGEEDLPPEVMLEGDEPVLELAVDEPFDLRWRARDDYGISSVFLRLDGKSAGSPLYRAQSRKGEVTGDVRRTPEELGLAAGDRVELQVAATDNDTVSGVKTGVSRTLELVILGARGIDARSEVATNELVDAMLGVLADHLEEPFPPSRVVGQVASWAEVVAARYEPLQAVTDKEWNRLPADGLERQVLTDALEKGGDLVRFGAVSFERGSQRIAVDADLEELTTLRDDAIVSLEDGILALDRVLRMKALRQVVDAAEKMETIGQELEELLASETPDSLAMLAKLEQLEAMMREMAEATAKLDEGGLKEFLNARENETKSLMDEVRKAIAEGRMDDAKKLMERLANQLQQVAEGVRDTLERQKGEGDQSMEQADQLKDELEALEQEQRDLQDAVKKLQEEAGADKADQQARLWKEIAEHAVAVHDGIEQYDAGLVAAERGFSETQRAQHMWMQAKELRAAAQLQDYRGTRMGHVAVTYALSALQRGLQTARMMNQAIQGPGKREIAAMAAHLDRIEELLDELDDSPASPEMQAASQDLAEQQRQLQERLDNATEKAEELAKDFPVRPGEMMERLGEGKKRMDEASQDLGEGKPMPAQGSQGAAADRIREAREELDKAMEQASQQQQQLQEGGSGSNKGEKSDDSDEKNGRDNNERPPDVQIPGAEEFRTPEEYRRALLEGMEADVPDEYRALKKRYFEELVRQ